MLSNLLISVGPLINQSLSAGIAIITGSFFLYTLVKDIGNRIARIFSALLFFVLVTYLADLAVSYDPRIEVTAAFLRFQWLGIAFAPATYAHLSHAILTMTGVPSRGRRAWAVHLLYGVAAIFLALVLFSDLVVHRVRLEPAPHLSPGPAFPVFVVYFLGAVAFGLWLVIRARIRALTQATRHRLTYLLISYPAPALSVFPFLLVSGRILSSPVVFYGVLIIVDAILAVMLSLMAYAMAFLGSLLPERMIKAQMLQFFLRGPVAALPALAVIIWVPRAGAFLGLPGDEAMPLLAVAVILFTQWAITLIRPWLERWLIYRGDQSEMRDIQELEQHLLTGADFRQLLDTILAAMCEYLRIETAFVVALKGNNGPHLERAIGLRDEDYAEMQESGALAETAINGGQPHPGEVIATGDVFTWRDYWLLPLHVQTSPEAPPRLVGILGMTAIAASVEELGNDHWRVLMALATRAAEVLEDRRIQSQVLASLRGLLPEMTTLEHIREAERRGGVAALTVPTESLLSSPDFVQKIKDALNHYWGGPRLTDSTLMGLNIFRQALAENDGNPQRAMRAILERAIESLRPEGQRSLTTTEWILYNILEMRFIQGRKVRDVAMRLAMSESDLYRKQRIAIEAVAGIIADMERASFARPGNGMDET